MSGIQTMAGARLAYVVVALEGTVKREVTSWSKKAGLVKKLVEVPAGFMVYFPRGHALRIVDKAMLERYGLNGEPNIINMQGLHDPRSPVGKLMTAQDESVRQGAYADLEQMVIRLATAKTGPVLLPEQLERAAA